MQLRSDYFPGHTFFNHAMQRAVLEDLVAIWQLYRRRGWEPKQVIIGVDAWLLDGEYWKEYWQVLRPAYDEIVRDWNLPSPNADLVRDAFADLDERRRLLVAATVGSEISFFKTQLDGLDEFVRRRDGSVSYHASFRERSTKTVMETIRNSVSFPRHQVSAEMLLLLRSFCAHLHADGVNVSFIIPPYHPTFYGLEGKNASGKVIKGYDHYLAVMNEVEQTIHRIADACSGNVIGSFDPRRVNARDDEFFDWIHPKPPVFERMLQ
jgi:hypothetical protein